MSANSEVKTQEIGYRWHISIDKELHVDSGTRTPDKVTVHASLEGHTDTYHIAGIELKSAKDDVLNMLKDVEKQATEEKPPAAT